MPAGRPTALTSDASQKILTALAAGNYLETAANFAGVTPQSVRGWIRRGKKEGKGWYHEFFSAVQKAIAEAELRDLETIRTASALQWQASAWRLERRFRERWSRDADVIRVILAELADIKKRLHVTPAPDPPATPASPAT